MEPVDPRLKREGWWALGSFVLALGVWWAVFARWKAYVDETVIVVWGAIYFCLLVIRMQLGWLSGVISRRLSSR